MTKNLELDLSQYELTFGFHSELDTRKVKEAGTFGRAKHMLLADLIMNSKHVGLIIVKAGYVTDFASVPRLPLAYMLTGDAGQKSATIHDKLCNDYYNSDGLIISWADAAKVFLEAMEYEGVPAWRRNLMYAGVRSYGLVTFKK